MSRAHLDTIEICVCEDCLVWLANADASGMTDENYARIVEEDAIGRNWPAENGGHWTFSIGPDMSDWIQENAYATGHYDPVAYEAEYEARSEGAFSWAGCDTCGMDLGATLWPAVAIWHAG